MDFKSIIEKAVQKRISIEIPLTDLVDAVLKEVTKEHGGTWYVDDVELEECDDTLCIDLRREGDK